MAGKLITLPLRVSLRSAQLLTRAATGVAGCVLAVPGCAIQAVSSARSGGAPTDAAPPPAPAEPTATPPAVPEEPAHISEERAPISEESAPVSEEPAPVSEEPAHISEEPVLVSEASEPGAEEGAGAGVHVSEPWTGYGQMNASDVIDRVPSASAAELAAMRLYEARHRARQSVLAAVDRQLKLLGGGHPA